MATKGEMLHRIFDRMDKLNLTDKMRKLFVKNNMSVADLTELKHRSESDFNAWQKMYKRNNRLVGFSTYTVIGR